jgi:hypothetical protein
MKKNGIPLEETFDLNDARTGWKAPRNNKDINKACDAWLEKTCPPKKKKRRFGNY